MVQDEQSTGQLIIHVHLMCLTANLFPIMDLVKLVNLPRYPVGRVEEREEKSVVSFLQVNR